MHYSTFFATVLASFLVLANGSEKCRFENIFKTRSKDAYQTRINSLMTEIIAQAKGDFKPFFESLSMFLTTKGYERISNIISLTQMKLPPNYLDYLADLNEILSDSRITGAEDIKKITTELSVLADRLEILLTSNTSKYNAGMNSSMFQYFQQVANRLDQACSFIDNGQSILTIIYIIQAFLLITSELPKTSDILKNISPCLKQLVPVPILRELKFSDKSTAEALSSVLDAYEAAMAPYQQSFFTSKEFIYWLVCSLAFVIPLSSILVVMIRTPSIIKKAN